VESERILKRDGVRLVRKRLKELLDRLLTTWEKKRPGWATSAQRKIDQVEHDWAEYML